MALTTKQVKEAMEEVWNHAADIMEERVRGVDRDFTNHHLAREMTHSVTLTYKYTVDSWQIEEVQQLLEDKVVVFIQPYDVDGDFNPYMEVTVCYSL